MDTTNSSAESLVGNWRSVAVIDPPASGYFRVTADFKFFAAEPMPPNSKRKVHYAHFRMLAENITSSTFTLRFAGKEGGSERRYFFEGDILVLAADVMDGERRWSCCHVAQEDLPEYFEPEFLIASTKPWN